MKYSPRNIIFCAVSKYLDDATYAKVMNQIGKEFPQQDRAFISIIKQHFDFELMKDKPVIWQDIWIYNYLKYDWDNHKFKRSARLLAKYEKEIIIPSEKSFKVLKHLTQKPLKKTSIPNKVAPKRTQKLKREHLNQPLVHGSEKNLTKNVKKPIPDSIFTPDIQVADIDGNIYKTVTIGTQVWMTDNLRVTKFNDGSPIPLVAENLEWNNFLTPGFCWHDNNEILDKAIYGALYNWYSVNDEKLCPKGWHVPTDIEWTELTEYLGGKDIAGGKLKERGNIHWQSPNAGATNESGFTALPGGSRLNNGLSYFNGQYAFFWSSTIYGAGLKKDAHCRFVSHDVEYISGNPFDMRACFSIRCIRDLPNIPLSVPRENFPRELVRGENMTLDLIREWSLYMHKPLEGVDSIKRYKIVSIFDPGNEEDCLNEVRDYKTNLSLNEARRQMEIVTYGYEWCGGIIHKITVDSSTVQDNDDLFPYTYKIVVQ